MRIIFVLILFIFSFEGKLKAQTVVIKTKQLKKYRYSPKNKGDSIPLENSTYRYDEKGRLLYKQQYFYFSNPVGALREERSTSFDEATSILDEQITHYSRNEKSPTYERLRTKYLLYDAQEDKSRHVWKSYIDESGEVVKEDTLTYDQDSNLIKQCIYNYGSRLSLFCENWKYNKRGQLKKNELYSFWTTINGRSKVVQKSERKLKYCYHYKKGRLTKARGKRFRAKIREDWTYDEAGKILSYRKQKIRKAKNTKSRRKEIKKKYTFYRELWQTDYKNGLMTKDVHLVSGKERKKIIMTYEADTLLKTYERFESGKLKLKEEFFYVDGKLNNKKTYHYKPNSQPHYCMSYFYNKEGKVLEAIHFIKDAKHQLRKFQYDQYGNEISNTLYNKNNEKIEKNIYIYDYY